MRTIIVCGLMAVCTVGCKHQGAISPQQAVITKPVAPKFHLGGVWLPDASSAFPQDARQPITVRKTDDEVFQVDLPSADDINIELRTASLGPHEEYAIADIVASIDGKEWLRYLGVIACKEDTLTVWWIESKDLAKKMHDEGHSAVIERSTFGTKVFADSDDLLDCVTKHSKTLVGSPTVFTRKTK